MIYITILIGISVVLFFSLLRNLFKVYKEKNYVVKCNKCGSTDTVLKNNDTKEKFFSYDYYVQDYVTYTIHNPPSFICNNCKQEYSIKEGTFIRKKKKRER